MPEINLAAVGPLSALWWPSALPGTNRVYSFDLDDAAQVDDAPAIAAFAISPSGDGELQATDLSVVGYQLLVQLTGGQPGREYHTAVTVTGLSGRIYQYEISILVSDSLLIAPPCAPPPPVPGFGTVISWTSGATVLGPAIAAVQAGLTGTGTNQATALLLTAQTNVASSVPTGTGFILSGEIISGTIVFQNDDTANTAAVYPPLGARINGLAVNAPFIVGFFGARISFSTQSATTQWNAG